MIAHSGYPTDPSSERTGIKAEAAQGRVPMDQGPVVAASRAVAGEMTIHKILKATTREEMAAPGEINLGIPGALGALKATTLKNREIHITQLVLHGVPQLPFTIAIKVPMDIRML